MRSQEKRANALTNKEKVCYYRRFSRFILAMNAFVIDAFEFCRLKERREADIAVADLPRLAADVVDKTGLVHWSLQGDNDKMGHPKLTLSVAGRVQLMCQRCLKPFAFDMASESILILAKNEESIEGIEAVLDDDAIDVIVGTDRLDVAELIEDEALLAIPLSPKHDVCPDQAALDALKDTQKPSPFAILKKLKQ
jgi:uncharacterized protein